MVYYVYAHIKKNGDIFYIGKGKGKRAWKKIGRSKYWNNITNKYSYDVVILKDNLSEHNAFVLEKQYISEIKGLCNLTNGGEGISGFIFPSSSLKKKSISAFNNTNKLGKKSFGSGRSKGIVSPFFGKHHTDESRSKMRVAKLNSKYLFEHKQNIAKSHSIQVECIENEIIFNSIKEASLNMNISARMILEVCKGIRNIAKGYTFKYIPCLD